ncbi:MAG: kinase, partial [Lachnospiraceae bacterium]|nr:kinase [Lachnospiraceae bacterium]
MSTLIILRGNSGSGKSSVAKALQRKFGRNTLVISQDIIRREMLWVCDGEDTLALPLLTELLRYGNTHCKYIILEGILNADWYKPLFELAIEIFKDKIFAYYYDIPFEETLKRHETRDKKFEFGEKEMRKWWNEKDFIGIIPEKVLKQEISFEEAVNIIFRDIS